MTNDDKLVELIIANTGKPWVAGMRGPDAYDCWGWAATVQAIGFGRELPIIEEHPESLRSLINFVKNHEARKNWRLVDAPQHGALVEMGHATHPFHIGTYLDIDGGGISHCMNGIGVSFDTLISLKTIGWRKVSFYEWVD